MAQNQKGQKMQETSFLFRLTEQDKEILDASAQILQQTRSAYLRSLIRNSAKQLPVIVQLNEGAQNEQDNA